MKYNFKDDEVAGFQKTRKSSKGNEKDPKRTKPKRDYTEQREAKRGLQ